MLAVHIICLTTWQPHAAARNKHTHPQHTDAPTGTAALSRRTRTASLVAIAEQSAMSESLTVHSTTALSPKTAIPRAPPYCNVERGCTHTTRLATVCKKGGVWRPRHSVTIVYDANAYTCPFIEAGWARGEAAWISVLTANVSAFAEQLKMVELIIRTTTTEPSLDASTSTPPPPPCDTDCVHMESV